MAKGDAKARIVPVRFNPELLKRVMAASKANKQSISEWIRSTLDAATNA
jgi:predicted HicB family RNase H-like nuclease